MNRSQIAELLTSRSELLLHLRDGLIIIIIYLNQKSSRGDGEEVREKRCLIREGVTAEDVGSERHTQKKKKQTEDDQEEAGRIRRGREDGSCVADAADRRKRWPAFVYLLI